jgi:hypothetical protein
VTISLKLLVTTPSSYLPRSGFGEWAWLLCHPSIMIPLHPHSLFMKGLFFSFPNVRKLGTLFIIHLLIYNLFLTGTLIQSEKFLHYLIENEMLSMVPNNFTFELIYIFTLISPLKPKLEVETKASINTLKIFYFRGSFSRCLFINLFATFLVNKRSRKWSSNLGDAWESGRLLTWTLPFHSFLSQVSFTSPHIYSQLRGTSCFHHSHYHVLEHLLSCQVQAQLWW